MPQMNRREFVATTAAAAAALALLGSIDLARGDDPPPPNLAPAPGQVDVGPLASYSADGYNDNWININKFVVVRIHGKIYAMTSVCTHKGCTLRVEADHLFCKCHKGTYGPDGVPTHRPPVRPLNRFAISLDKNNHLIVDTSRTFDPAHWTDAASFVVVK